MGHVLGAEKNNFFNSRYDDPTTAGASVESYHIVVLRSPRARLGSVLGMRNRLRRMRGGFQRRYISVQRGQSAPVPSIVDEN